MRRIPLATEEQTFHYQGDLAEATLPEILFTIDRFQVPGILEASRESVVKRIYIRGGTVLHASSTDLEDSLGAFLLRSGRLSPDEYATTMKARRNSSARYGVLLVEQSFLSPAEVYTAIREQIEEIVWGLFSWHEGRVTFQIGEYKDSGAVRIHLPMRQVILRGIKRAPEAKPLVARLGPRETIYEPSFHSESLVEIALEKEDYELLRMIDGARTLYDLCKDGPYSVSENAKVLYAFHILRLIRKVGTGGGEEKSEKKPQSGAIKIRLSTAGDRFRV